MNPAEALLEEMSGNEPALMPSKCSVAGGPCQVASGVWEQRNGCGVWG